MHDICVVAMRRESMRQWRDCRADTDGKWLTLMMHRDGKRAGTVLPLRTPKQTLYSKGGPQNLPLLPSAIVHDGSKP